MTAGNPEDSVVGVFDRAAETYDQLGVDYFRVFGRRLVEIAELRPAERVLDLGCGRGAVLFPAAEAVGVTGDVLAIDLAPGMVARTSAEVSARGLRQAAVQLGDAAHPRGEPGSADAILAGFVLFFLDDLDRALRHYARLLRPAGRLAFSWFGDHDERWTPVIDAAKAYVPMDQQEPGSRDGDSPWRDVTSLEEVVRATGYRDVTTAEEQFVSRFRDPAHWFAWSWSHGMRAVWEAVPPEHRGAARTDAEAAMEGVRDLDGSPTLISNVRYTVARGQ